MSHTPKEIELCRHLHNLRVRPEIREGNWIFDNKAFNNCVLVSTNDDCDWRNESREEHILLFSWERCREWLRERGWKLTGHNEHPKEITCSFYNEKSLRDEFGRGQTDLEAILAAMVQVAEGEKYE